MTAIATAALYHPPGHVEHYDSPHAPCEPCGWPVPLQFERDTWVRAAHACQPPVPGPDGRPLDLACLCDACWQARVARPNAGGRPVRATFAPEPGGAFPPAAQPNMSPNFREDTERLGTLPPPSAAGLSITVGAGLEGAYPCGPVGTGPAPLPPSDDVSSTTSGASGGPTVSRRSADLAAGAVVDPASAAAPRKCGREGARASLVTLTPGAFPGSRASTPSSTMPAPGALPSGSSLSSGFFSLSSPDQGAAGPQPAAPTLLTSSAVALADEEDALARARIPCAGCGRMRRLGDLDRDARCKVECAR